MKRTCPGATAIEANPECETTEKEPAAPTAIGNGGESSSRAENDQAAIHRHHARSSISKHAGPAVTGTGASQNANASSTQRKRYQHPERVAIRKDRAAFERMLRAILAFNSLSADEQRLFSDHLTGIMAAGQPVPAFDGVMVEAAFWADMAEPRELEAYCLASFSAMPRSRQAAFLDHVQERAVA